MSRGSPTPQKVSTLTGQQKRLLNQLLGVAGRQLPGAEDIIGRQASPERAREQFEQVVADPAMLRFRSETIPAILQQSANLGAKGGSSIERQLARAGSSLERDLAAQFTQFQTGQEQQAIQNLLGLLLPGVGQQAFALQQPSGQPSFGRELGGAAIQALPALLAAL